MLSGLTAALFMCSPTDARRCALQEESALRRDSVHGGRRRQVCGEELVRDLISQLLVYICDGMKLFGYYVELVGAFLSLNVLVRMSAGVCLRVCV